MRRPRFQLIYKGDPARSIYLVSGAVFLIGLALILLEIIVFGVIFGAPDWVYPPMWVTVVVWILGTLTMCTMMIVEVILRLRGKPATFGIATIGGRYIEDVRPDADELEHGSGSP
ncbi:hypothetical protein PX701_11105 [Agromyces sp. H3Y2-19a]|uniref:hypothetical protein n=1 Tax=Agromyces TaxID=33877 RepID=UPI001E3B1BD3|nr:MULTISPECIES: hypothetical protein [Agromyces]MCD5348226.1 hypothetical protein [Agromyces sp. S2-1-8]MDF0514169.1 hypothetical protein [Agromyces chromiiresistens]